MCSRRWQSEPSCLESSATPVTLRMGGEDPHKKKKNISILHLEVAGFVFTAECLLTPFFHCWPCAQFPHYAVLLPLQDGDKCSLCHPTVLAWSRSSVFQVTEHSGLHPDLRGLPREHSLRLDGLTAGVCHHGSLHRTDLPMLTLT